MANTYVFYSDPGHGWIAVERQELMALGILFQVSHYSYQKGNMVYLEEDCDASLFIKAKRDAGIEVKLVEHDSNYDSHIRNYSPFCSK